MRSTDKHFRPADPQIGPDGALWFGDWANPLIGHMQYCQRDPNRDHIRGRVYRLVGTRKQPVKPVTQFGKSMRRDTGAVPRVRVADAVPGTAGAAGTAGG